MFVMKIKLLFFSLMLALFGCNSYDDMITDWYYTSDELEKWIPDSTELNFIMHDQNGISRDYLNWWNNHNFSGGSSSFAGVTYHKSQREYYYQSFRSNYFDEYSISIDPAFNDDYWGEQIRFEINNVGFQYDFMFEEILDLDVNDHRESLQVSSEGIESDSLFKSTFELLDSYRVGNTTYGKTFHFELLDMQQYWDEFTIIEIYYAQNTGLLRYEMKNGLVFERVTRE